MLSNEYGKTLPFYLFMDVMQLAVVVIVALVVAVVVEVRAARVDPAAALDR